jgi:hypothetical protein
MADLKKLKVVRLQQDIPKPGTMRVATLATNLAPATPPVSILDPNEADTAPKKKKKGNKGIMIAAVAGVAFLLMSKK